MNHLSKKIIGISVLLLFISAVTAATDLFKALDTDQDGVISKSEASVHSVLSEMFDTLDTDTSGTLSKEEFSAAGLED